jgi:hypothetical protein
MGVAQITRSRDGTFIARLCSATLFSISSIWRADCCVGTRPAGFPPFAPRPHRIERPKRRLHDKNDPRNHRRRAAAIALLATSLMRKPARVIATIRDDSSRAATPARSNAQRTPKGDWIAETLVLQARNARPERSAANAEQQLCAATRAGRASWRAREIAQAALPNRGADVSRA